MTVDILSDTFVLIAEPRTSRVVAYWEAGNLISTTVETGSDLYILEVCLSSSFLCCALNGVIFCRFAVLIYLFILFFILLFIAFVALGMVFSHAVRLMLHH